MSLIAVCITLLPAQQVQVKPSRKANSTSSVLQLTGINPAGPPMQEHIKRMMPHAHGSSDQPLHKENNTPRMGHG